MAIFTDLQNRIADIGQISGLIGTIANQTNLLALNATIEAASAGAVGHSFTVVASEVKALSNRVTRATTAIATQVGQLRQVADSSTASLARVRDEIGAVQQNATDIARVSTAHRAAADTIADGVTRARATILQATSHLDALRTTTAQAVASSQTLGETSVRLRDQGRELNQTASQLAGSRR